MARLKHIRVIATDGGSPEELDIRQPIDIEVEYWALTPGPLLPTANLAFYNDEGVCLFITNDWAGRTVLDKRDGPTIVRSTCTIPGNLLAEGRAIVTVAVSTFNPPIAHAIERDAIAFHVVDRSEGDGARGDSTNEWPGVVRPALEWKTALISESDPIQTSSPMATAISKAAAPDVPLVR